MITISMNLTQITSHYLLPMTADFSLVGFNDYSPKKISRSRKKYRSLKQSFANITIKTK